MGGAIAARLSGAGFEPALYDIRGGPGLAPSLTAAAAGADLALFCLPDESAVRIASHELLKAEPLPKLLVDLTSSLPATTREVALLLAQRGIGMIDAPLSGGVAGARDGRLTAMVGGDEDLLERARTVLATFASQILWAGPLGAGHAIKAINNALSAASLAVTCEMLVRAQRAGLDGETVVDQWNRGPARSQNSEVKLPRDVLPRTYASGFTVGLMEKDVATALRIAEAHDLSMPVTAAVHSLWSSALVDLGPAADFTQIHRHLSARTLPAAGSPELMGRAIAAVCLLAARELIPLAEMEQIERGRALEIVNASSGRSEATRAALAWDLDSDALDACRPILTLGGD
jgi:3-hydroxyisobutyrate dehydrogenase